MLQPKIDHLFKEFFMLNGNQDIFYKQRAVDYIVSQLNISTSLKGLKIINILRIII